MEKYEEKIKHRLVVWLVLWAATLVLILSGIDLKSYFPAISLLFTFFLFPLYLFSYCLKLPVLMARDNFFSDKPVSATVLTWRKVFYFFSFVTLFLAAAAGYLYFIFTVIGPFLEANGFVSE